MLDEDEWPFNATGWRLKAQHDSDKPIRVWHYIAGIAAASIVVWAAAIIVINLVINATL